MSGENQRILLHITMLSNNDPEATKKVDSTFLRFNNILSGNGQLPNITQICDYCDNVNKELGAYIRNRCLDIKREDTLFDPTISKTNSMLNIIKNSERKNIRILLYPGNKTEIEDLKMKESTHNMIVRFNEDNSRFKATESHKNPPSFYQNCDKEETALLYFEALMVDACICHYLGVSDVALHHDDKQQISSEKVMFLKEIVKEGDFDFLSENSKELVKYVAAQLHDCTPYISFLSIFTIASFDVFGSNEIISDAYFEDYCSLWSAFQKWYFNKHGRLFLKNKKVKNPLEIIFDRNKYQGQISPVEIAKKINDICKNFSAYIDNPPFGKELRFAVVIIKHMPDNLDKIKKFESLFSGQLHQSKWDIIYWGDINKYNDILSDLEIVPFIIA